MQIEVTGLIPTAEPNITNTDGSFEQHWMLACRPKFNNGKLVEVEFTAYKYHFFQKISDNQKIHISACSISKADLESGRFPNWPHPEPEAST